MDLNPPALYQLLLEDLYEQEPSIKEFILNPTSCDFGGLSTRKAACQAIAKAFLKKLEVANNDLLDSRALLKFIEADFGCESWSRPEGCFENVLFNEFKNILQNFFSPNGAAFPGVYEAMDHGDVGPGSALLVDGGDFYTKLSSAPMTCSSLALYTLYEHWCSFRPTWRENENFRKAEYGAESLVRGSRICFVPKNDTISRSICVEPNLNMFVQLGFGRLIEKRLLEFFGINLKDQQFKNRDLARRGSLIGCYSTIDLESASDTISLKMLKECLPADVYKTICLLRSPETWVDGLGWRKLSMVSSMGNGFTFPLETAIFACATVAAMRVSGVKLMSPRGRSSGNFGVFGDDIIVPVEATEKLIELLNILGFKVNSGKSYWTGPFRESCGADFLNGVNIRGVYLKRYRTIQDAFSLINQLNLFSARTGVKLRRLVQALHSEVPWTPVPRWENDDAGVKMPFGALSRKRVKLDRHVQSVLYYAYRAKPLLIKIGESYITIPKRLRRSLSYNPHGLLLSLLRGTINSGSISVRHDGIRYRRKRCIAPSWDYTPDPHPFGWFPWQQWDTAAYINLFG